MTATGILLCAGKGERLAAGLDKALVPLAGRPLFSWSLDAFERSPAIDRVVVVGPVKRLKEMLAAAGIAPRKVVAWCEGGRERQDSVGRGLREVPDDAALVAIHDCARVLVTPELIARVVGDAVQHGAAIAALPLGDTLKRGALGVIETTDDAALVEALGHRVHLTPGEPLNLKITTPQDLELAEAWLTRTSARI